MQIDRGLAVEVGRGTHLELLADPDCQLLNSLTNSLARGQDRGIGRLDTVGLARRYAFTASAASAWNDSFLATKSVPPWSKAPSMEATSPFGADRSAPAWPLWPCR